MRLYSYALVGATWCAVAACSPAAESGDTEEAIAGDGDGDEFGDGDQIYLGTGGAPTHTSGGGAATGGDGDDSSAGGEESLNTGDGDGDGDDGAEPPASGGSASGSGGGSISDGGAPMMIGCNPNEAGAFIVSGETVLDERTCLTWTRSNTSGDPYAAAVAYCDGLSLGGYDDWRLPTAGEAATIFRCDGMWPPIDDTVFNIMGDGIWTSTESGTTAGDLPKVCGAGQSSGQYYDFGQVGGQNTRCVRGQSHVADRSDCGTSTVICQ